VCPLGFERSGALSTVFGFPESADIESFLFSWMNHSITIKRMYSLDREYLELAGVRRDRNKH
jgi:hypothetical protein